MDLSWETWPTVIYEIPAEPPSKFRGLGGAKQYRKKEKTMQEGRDCIEASEMERMEPGIIFYYKYV